MASRSSRCVAIVYIMNANALGEVSRNERVRLDVGKAEYHKVLPELSTKRPKESSWVILIRIEISANEKLVKVEINRMQVTNQLSLESFLR